MSRLVQIVAVVIAVFAFCAGAGAQNAANGEQIYQSVCASCHGPNAAANVNGIVTTGANNPAGILAAWQSVGQMNFLLSLYDASDRADIAAYLGVVAGGGGPAAGEITLTSSALDFGAQPVGTTSAAQRVTVMGTSGSVAIMDVASNNAPEFPIVADTCTFASLGPGATCHIDVAFRPAAAGPRGATFAIANNGAVSPVSFTAVGTGGAAAPVNYQGLWWNPAESGWGINLAHQGDQVYLTWYTYDAAGRASWLAMLASRNAAGAYVGDILEFRGPPYTAVPFAPAPVGATVGSGTLTFTDASNGQLSYTAKGVTQTKAITRFVFGPMPTCAYAANANLAAATNFQDLWWNGSESGWGINLSHQGNQIYATWYTYDSDGSPLWLAALMARDAAGSFTGAILRFVGPAFAATFDPTKVVPATVGTATVSFANGNAATWTYTIGPTSASKAMTRFQFGAGGTVCQ